MKHIALIGARGFVGSCIYKKLLEKNAWSVDAVTRENYSHMKKNDYDVVINAAMPSARFWAKNNPNEDFKETVEKTADIVYGWKYKKFVQISTISARTELNTVYGRHKAAAEVICDIGEDLIVRLSAMYSESLQKGALIDILNGKKVFVDIKSRYAFASLEFVSEWIVNNLNKKGICEVGAKNTVSLEQIITYLNITIPFEGRVDVQEIKDPSPDFPDANEVLKFLAEKQKRSV